MLRALGRSVADLGNHRVLTIMLEALAISVLVFLTLGGVLVWVLAGFDACKLASVGACPVGVGWSIFGAIILTLLGAWFLFPAVAITVMTGMVDRISSAVEEAHYPEAVRSARPIGIGRGTLIGLKSAARLVGFNLIAMPFYLLLLVTGVGPFILFVIVNGIAFGHDVAELAASRHGDRQSRRAWLKKTRGQQHLIGLAVSVLFLVPFANLLAPVIGAAAGIHLFNDSFSAMSPGKRAVGRSA
jgi:CysZ protein